MHLGPRLQYFATLVVKPKSHAKYTQHEMAYTRLEPTSIYMDVNYVDEPQTGRAVAVGAGRDCMTLSPHSHGKWLR
jgi:hypothetical protein